jgi:hypothetical protein
MAKKAEARIADGKVRIDLPENSELGGALKDFALPSAQAKTDMHVSIKGGRVYIDLPLYPTPVLSASGKTLVIASSRGSVMTDASYEGFPVIVGLNVYYKHRAR